MSSLLIQPQTSRIVVKAPNGEDVVFWEPFQKQIDFHVSDVNNLLARGSRGSGKSELLRNDAHIRGMSVRDRNMVLIRKTMRQLNESHLLYIEKEMKALGGTYHQTKFMATYPTGSRLFFSYVGHENDALNLLSAEFIAGYFDELSTIPWDYYLKLSASIRTKKGSGIKTVTRAATNPFGESAGEIEKYYVLKDVDPEEDPEYDPNEWGYIQINMEDNPHIDLEQYKKRFAGLPPHLRKAWLEGEYADEEALFDFRASIDGRPFHVINDLDIPTILKHAQIYRAIDYGWWPDPSYVLWIAHLGNRFIAFHEMVKYKTIIPDLAELIKEQEARLGIKQVHGTYVDPTLDVHTGAEIRTNKEILDSNGIPSECSINNRELFASAVHTALAEEVGDGVPRLQIYKGIGERGCPYLVKALPLMRYDPKRPMRMADHKHDHPVVALAYFLISHASYERKPMINRALPKWMRPKKVERWVLGSDGIRRRKY